MFHLYCNLVSMIIVKLFKIHISKQCTILSIGLISLLFAACGILDDDEILAAEIIEIETYASANGIDGSFLSSDIYISILDTGIIDSFVIDTLTFSIVQTDTTLLLDSVLVDTTLIETFLTVDTFSIDSPLPDRLPIDTFTVEEFPSSSDTVLILLTGQTLSGNIFVENTIDPLTLSDGSYPILSDLLTGLNSGLQEIRAGGSAILLIPSSLAYDRSGNGDEVPPSTPIRIDVELLEFRSR